MRLQEKSLPDNPRAGLLQPSRKEAQLRRIYPEPDTRARRSTEPRKAWDRASLRSRIPLRPAGTACSENRKDRERNAPQQDPDRDRERSGWLLSLIHISEPTRL